MKVLLQSIYKFLHQPMILQEKNLREIIHKCIEFLNHFQSIEQQLYSSSESLDIKITDELKDQENLLGLIPICQQEIQFFVMTLSTIDSISGEILIISILKIIKVLLHQPENRKLLGNGSLACLVKLFQKYLTQQKNWTIASEICHVFLNACYEKSNVQTIVDHHILPLLIKAIQSKDMKLVTSGLGTLQAVCYVPLGRLNLRNDPQAISILVHYLSHSVEVIRARSLGTLHNLSVDIISIGPIVNTGCLSIVLDFIRQENQSEELLVVALGLIQNLTRDFQVREIACSQGAIDLVSKQLMSSNTSCQVAALSTMMNLISPTLSPSEKNQLYGLFADSIALGAINSLVFGSK